jgi:hypothetical protein
MIVLDKSRALDLMISRSEHVLVPEPFNSGFWVEPPNLKPANECDASPGHPLTNLLRTPWLGRARAEREPQPSLATTSSVPVMP